MSLIRPFAGLRPAPLWDSEVIAPPYDVVSVEEAKFQVIERPWSFLHISRPEIDLPEQTNPYAPEVYIKAKENLSKMLNQGIMLRDATPNLYIYRLTMGEIRQTGLVAATSVTAYNANQIKKHELTRPAKEDDRVRHIETLAAQTGPVLLAYPSDLTIDGLLHAHSQTKPVVDVDLRGVRHELWVLQDPNLIDQFVEAFAQVPTLYIADGHHRSAAASRVAATRHGVNSNHTGNESYNYFLAVIFPHNQLNILSYNRLIKDLNGLTPDQFFEKLQPAWVVQASPTPVIPTQSHQFGLYLDGAWYKLILKIQPTSSDPTARLDVSLLAEHLLEPILGIKDQRRDERIDFIGGIRGTDGLKQQVDAKKARIGITLYPTSMSDLMAIADAGLIMPPKSTWFEPKLADGLVSHILD
ncbi:hypothetical protein TI04_03180 [Achromatium sp. WMS2]|nr:hypothetical protein TI04_03180 [Achromatium sp. WMS2]